MQGSRLTLLYRQYVGSEIKKLTMSLYYSILILLRTINRTMRGVCLLVSREVGCMLVSKQGGGVILSQGLYYSCGSRCNLLLDYSLLQGN